MHHNRIAEGRLGQDLVRCQILLRELHDLASCLSGILQEVPHGSRYQCCSRQRQAKSLCYALHGGGCPQERAGSHGGTSGQFIIPHLLRRDGSVSLLTQRNITCQHRCGHVRPRPHRAARHEDRRDVQSCNGFQMSRNRLIAARGQHHAIPLHGASVNLDHVGDGFTGSQHIVHAVAALRAAVADVGRIIFCRLSAHLIDAVRCLLHHLVQVIAARMGVAVHALNHDLRLQDIPIIPAGPHLQRIELRPELALRCTSLIHNFLRSISFISN